MARSIGIMGGGQLGMMLTEAASGLAEVSNITVLDPTPGCPASISGARQITAGLDDESAIRELAAASDILTYEIESGNCDVLERLGGKTEINPSPGTLRTIQDKLVQKEFLAGARIPVGEFTGINDLADIEDAVKRFGLPALLKSRRDAYDGRGNLVIRPDDPLDLVAGHFGDRPVYVERMIDFKMEVSVIAARSTSGEIVTYPAVENIHRENILHTTIAPARIGEETAAEAKRVATDVIRVLRGAGVFGIEMFVTQDDRILVNEIAPRVHNSGHHTLVSSATSQFEQHLRAILGMDLGRTDLERNAVMCNILGPKEFTGSYRNPDPVGDAAPKMYRKKESRPQRKLGHYTVTAPLHSDIDELLSRATAMADSMRVLPA